MRALALDPVTHDLALSSGRASLVTGIEAKAQHLKCRLLLWEGEYRMDTSRGIPYARMLGDKSQTERLPRVLRAAASTSPGIARASFDFELGSNRLGRVSNLQAVTTDGEPLSLDAFDATGVT